MSLPVGAPQGEATGDMSFTPQLCGSAAAEKVEIVRMNEVESEEPVAAGAKGCPGTSGEPAANPGKLCVFQGGSTGTKESQWKNIKGPNKPVFIKAGSFTENATEPGIVGEFIGWQSAQYSKVTITTVTAATYLATGGSWALTAP
jgi:hypothetical protein